LIKSAEMIAGEAKKVLAVSLLPGESPDAFEAKVNDIMGKIDNEDTLILIDIFSGTPYNITARQVLKENVECVTGVNLPMLIEAILSRDSFTVKELAEFISQSGTDSIKYLKPLLTGK
ncbi:MAG: PTS sugar transporter subunit IIA, partial [Anaerolineaceae bacterium]|nr:PTS sugar transporter subunit IIA [Anaerolineaceae bacterium]